MKTKMIERFADNGEHSHYELIDVDSGCVLWSEDTETLNQPDAIRSNIERHTVFGDNWIVYPAENEDKNV